jgi:type IX secretion system substrate protein/NHL repeat-containing protein
VKHTLFILAVFLGITGNCQIISTVAGNGLTGDGGDGGAATNASAGNAGGIVFDTQGNYYYTEFNSRIRKISTVGIISTIAGNGISGSSGDGGPATAAQLNNPSYINIDTSGNLYISDVYNNKIRKINMNTGIITTVVGNGIGTYGGDGAQATAASLYSPSGTAFDDSGNLYIADFANYRVRKVNTLGIISTIAGNGIMGWGPNGIPATATELEGPNAVRVDAEGNVYFADINRIRKIDKKTGLIYAFAGVIDTVVSGSFNCSGDGGLAVSAHTTNVYDFVFDKFGNCFLSDQNCDKIRVVDKYGYISTFAGTGNETYNGDGQHADSANLYSARGIALDSCGNLYIADNGHARIRKVSFLKCDYLSVTNQVPNSKLSIYPNPAYDILNINNLQAPAIYTLQSIVGATIQQGTLKEGNNSINIQALPDGMYMLEIVDNEGKRKVNKIVKQ